MNIELLLSVKRHNDTLIEQTRKQPRETLEFKMNNQMQSFSYNPPINLSEEDKWMLAVTSFQTANSVIKILMKTIVFQLVYQVIDY